MLCPSFLTKYQAWSLKILQRFKHTLHLQECNDPRVYMLCSSQVALYKPTGCVDKMRSRFFICFSSASSFFKHVNIAKPRSSLRSGGELVRLHQIWTSVLHPSISQLLPLGCPLYTTWNIFCFLILHSSLFYSSGFCCYCEGDRVFNSVLFWLYFYSSFKVRTTVGMFAPFSRSIPSSHHQLLLFREVKVLLYKVATLYDHHHIFNTLCEILGRAFVDWDISPSSL